MIRKPKRSDPVPQPVFQPQQHNISQTCMISNNPEIVGAMTSLKKILMNVVEKEVRKITPTYLKMGLTICHSGVDSLNFHFAGKYMHVPFIELMLISNGAIANIAIQMLEISNSIRNRCNELLMELANMKSTALAHSILEKCDNDTLKSHQILVFAKDNENRSTIDFVYSENKEKKQQPFIELRYYANPRFQILDKFGSKYVSLGDVCRDIKSGIMASTTPDWRFRKQSFDQSITRHDLTLSHWAMRIYMRICFPAIAMRKLNARGQVEEDIHKAIALIPEEQKGASNDLRASMLSELNKYQDNATIEDITLNILIERSVALGLFPSDQTLKYALNNAINDNVVYELKIEALQ